MSKNLYHGSCLCNSVKIEVTGPIDSIIYCHCSRCRKSNGSAFAANGYINTADLKIVEGSELVRFYEAPVGKKRHFCGVCASPIFSSNQKDPERVRLRLGILDDDISERPVSHNFVSSKANWENINEDLPMHDSYEPGRDLTKQFTEMNDKK